MSVLNLKSEHWAYDLSKDVIKTAEVFDQNCINQSIELILSTFFGERLFNIGYGSSLPLQIGENMNNQKGEKLIEEVLNSLLIEDRIVVDRENVQFKFSGSQGTLEIQIPYFVIKQKLVSFFSKIISI